MKICYLSFRETLDTNLEQLSRCVASHGHVVTIINISNESKKPKCTEDGRKIVYLNLRGRVHLTGRIQFRIKRIIYLLEIINLLNKYEYEIIHLDTGCPYFGLLKLLFKKSKFVYHIQSYPVSLKKIRTDVFKKLISVFLQSILMDAVIIQSKEQKERWIGTGRLRKTKIVPIGFNKKSLYPLEIYQKNELRQKKGIGVNIPVLIYAGAMTRQRMLDRLIFAIKEVCEEFPMIKVLMIGDGDYSVKLKSLVRSLNLQNHIIFTGMVSYDKMVEYYGIADIGISYIPINKNYNYNPPLKTYEYLACGLPCIATRTVSNRMIIRDKLNGILVDDNVKDISVAIKKLLKDKSLLKNLKMNSRKSVKDYDFDNIANCYLLPIYRDILCKSRSL